MCEDRLRVNVWNCKKTLSAKTDGLASSKSSFFHHWDWSYSSIVSWKVLAMLPCIRLAGRIILLFILVVRMQEIH